MQILNGRTWSVLKKGTVLINLINAECHFRLFSLVCPSILMNGPTDFAQTHFFRFVMVEMTILGFDIWSFVFVYGYIDPKWGMFWFLSLMIMSFKTLLTGKSRQNLLIGWVFAFTFDTLECNKSRKTPGCH